MAGIFSCGLNLSLFRAYGCEVSILRLAQIVAAVPGERVAVSTEEAQGILVEVGRKELLPIRSEEVYSLAHLRGEHEEKRVYGSESERVDVDHGDALRLGWREGGDAWGWVGGVGAVPGWRVGVRRGRCAWPE